jgi:hypothetical protein
LSIDKCSKGVYNIIMYNYEIKRGCSFDSAGGLIRPGFNGSEAATALDITRGNGTRGAERPRAQ